MDNMIGMIVNGEEFPQLTMDQINEMSKKQAQKLSGCTREKALELLEKNGTQLAAFIKALSDDDLDRKANMAAFGGEVSTEPVVVGPLSRAKEFDVGTDVYARALTAGEIRKKLGLE